MIDSRVSGNYVRRRSPDGSQQYAEALKVHEGDVITVRLATEARVTVHKVPLNLGVKFVDFESIKRCLVVDLSRDMKSFSVWSCWNGHEPLIEWRSSSTGGA